MLFKGKQNIYNTEEKEILIECSCGTHLIKISSFDDESEELDDELVAYCERILAKVLSLIFTLALSRALAIT